MTDIQISCVCLAPLTPVRRTGTEQTTAQVSPDGRQVLQKVEVVGRYPADVRRLVDVQLTKEDECWRVDAITFEPA